jgi:hypothetical protein
VTVRVQLTSERPVETASELSDCAGSDPELRDGWLVWKFHSRERGSLFLVNARVTAGVAGAWEA